MKRVLKSFKKVILGFIAFLYTLATNNYAATQELYGVMPVEKPMENVVTNTTNPNMNINPALKILLIPAIFAIGIVIYLLKSKDTKKKKVLIIIVAAILAICIALTIYNIERAKDILY